MARLRIRNPANTDWIDICKSQWYQKQNGSWKRIMPCYLKARHGADLYWEDITCDSGTCGDDEYGGIGTDNPEHPANGGGGGDNYGPINNGGTSSTWPGDTGTVDPITGRVETDPVTGKPLEPIEATPTPIMYDPPPGDRTPGTPVYDPRDPTDVWIEPILGTEPPVGGWTPVPDPDDAITVPGFPVEPVDPATPIEELPPVGIYDPIEGIYTPLPGLPGTEIVEPIDDGNPDQPPLAVDVPGFPEPITYIPPGDGNNTGPGDGSILDPAQCPTTISSDDSDAGIVEVVVSLGEVSGKVPVIYNFLDGPGRVEAFHNGVQVIDTGEVEGIGLAKAGEFTPGQGLGTVSGNCLYLKDSDECIPYYLHGGLRGDNQLYNCGAGHQVHNENRTATGYNGSRAMEWEIAEYPFHMGTANGDFKMNFQFLKPNGKTGGMFVGSAGRIEVFHKGVVLYDSGMVSSGTKAGVDPQINVHEATIRYPGYNYGGASNGIFDGNVMVRVTLGAGTAYAGFGAGCVDQSTSTGDGTGEGAPIAIDGTTTGQGMSGRAYFDYDSATNPNDNTVLLRVWKYASSDWSVKVECPGAHDELDDDGNLVTNPVPEPGDPDLPAPCAGTFEPAHGGGKGINEMYHDMGEGGSVHVLYQMWYQPDMLEVIYRNEVLATTGGMVDGVGELIFDFTPVGNDTSVTFRITSGEEGTSWVYLLSCPGDDGSLSNPRPCGEVTQANGFSRMDTYYDLGANVGVVTVDYEMYGEPDEMSVSQNGTVLATTGGLVSNDGALEFEADGADGLILVTVKGNVGANWAYKVHCPAHIPLISVTNADPDASIIEQSDGNNPLSPFNITLDKATTKPVTVKYTTVDGTAIAGAASKNLAYDEFGNPFIAVTDDGAGRIVMDGGFPKFYNSHYPVGASGFAALPNQFKFIYNALQWVAKQNGTGKILITGDKAVGSYGVMDTSPTASGFGYGLPATAVIAGFTVDLKSTSEFGAPLDASYADLTQYDAIVFMSTLSSVANYVTPTMVSAIEQVRLEGTGLIVITDHDVFQYSANLILAPYDAQFTGNVNRNPVSVDYLVSAYGAHPLWANITGDMLAGGSEGNITIPEGGDYFPRQGTVTFAPGEIIKTVDVEIIADNILEGDENFQLRIYDASFGDINPIDFQNMLIIDDEAPSIPCGGNIVAGGTEGTAAVHPMGTVIGLVEFEFSTVTGGGTAANQMQVFSGPTVVADTGNVVVPDTAPEVIRFMYNGIDPNADTELRVIVSGDSWWQYSISCPFEQPPIDAYVFDTSAEVNLMKASYVPPSAAEVFTDWPRAEGELYFADGASAGAPNPGNNIGYMNWELLTNPDRVSQPENTGQSSVIISPRKYGNFTLEATVTSPGGDNDQIGLLLGFKRVGAVNHSLILFKNTQAGSSHPATPTTFGLGLVVDTTLTVLISAPELHVLASGWSGKQCRLKAVRSGDVFECWCSSYENTDVYLAGSKMTLDLASNPALSVFLGESSYGYFTWSQPGSTYLDVSFDAAGVTDMLFDRQTDTAWKYSAGSWGVSSLTWQESLGYYRAIHNPVTGEDYQIYPDRLDRDVQFDVQLLTSVGRYPGSYYLGQNPAGVSGSSFTAETTFNADAGSGLLRAWVDDIGDIYVNGVSVGSAGMSDTRINITLLQGSNHVRFVIHEQPGNSPSGFDCMIEQGADTGNIICVSDGSWDIY